MSGSEPPNDLQKPDRQPPATSPQPPLVFKPDEKQSARIARVRVFSFVAAAVLLVAAFILIISYRPPPVKLSNAHTSGATSPPVESAAPATPQATAQAVPAARQVSGVDIARSAVAAIDTLVGAASGKWARATELAAQGTVTRDNAEQAVDGFRRAASLADSAREDVRSAQQQADLVRSASRQAGSGAGFRLSVLYSAMDRYLKSLDQDAADRREYYLKLEASAQAMLQGDGAESEIQQNVAMSYLRHSEDRQASLKRLEEQMREAQGNIGNAGR